MIERLKQESFDEIFEIMEKSFPKDEYRTYEGQKRLFSEPEYQVYGMRDSESGRIRGFIAVWELEFVVFIEHFAVNPEFRNGGIGSQMLKELQKKFSKIICLEVELPETEMAVRRIGFYERNGFVLNRYPYMQPPLAKGQNPIPLYIMTTERAVGQDEFEKIRDLLYATVYQLIG
ncbi:MAG: GNAT family N-acetyltransferase [Brotaphodocola sp.]